MEMILWNTVQNLVLSMKKKEIAELWEKESSYPEDRGSPTVTVMSTCGAIWVCQHTPMFLCMTHRILASYTPVILFPFSVQQL